MFWNQLVFKMLSPLVREEFFFAKTALLLLTLLSPRGDNWGFSAVPGCNFGQRMFLGVFILLAAMSKLVSGFIFRTYLNFVKVMQVV